jgi:hypothetical protein
VRAQSTRGLYHSELGRALKRHGALALRSETQGDYREQLFVDLNQIDLLDTPDWQVIYGRRGTGKTFMLSMMEDRVNQRFREGRQLALLITAQDCLASPVGVTVDDQIRALAYFQRLIEILGDKLADHADRILGKPSLLDGLSGARKRAADRIVSAVVEMLELTQTGRKVSAFDDVRRETTEKVASNRHRASGLNADASLRMRSAKLAAEASLGRKDEHSRTSETLTQTSRPAVPHFPGVRDVIVGLLEVLQVQRLYILIDEWSVLDPSGATDIQPTIAEMLKRSFAGTPRISVKLATNRYQTRLSNRGAGTSYKGFEVGADIFEGVNLDRALLQREDLYAFYEQLLFKRLVYVEPAVSVFATADGGGPNEQFVRSIFKDKRAFAELIKAAEGVPRTFVALVKAMARMHDFKVTPLWTIAAAHRCILEKSERAEDDTDYKSEAAQLLTERIKPVVTATRSRVFLVPKPSAGPISKALDELFEKRLIHEYPNVAIAGAVRERWYAYQVDYGVWLDWVRALPPEESAGAIGQIGRVLTRAPHLLDPGGGERAPRLQTVEDAGDHVIDQSSLGSNDLVTCQSCNSRFSRAERCFELRGLCPNCFFEAAAATV